MTSVHQRLRQPLKLQDQPADLPMHGFLALLEQTGQGVDLGSDDAEELGPVGAFFHGPADVAQGDARRDDLAGDFGRMEHGAKRCAVGGGCQ